MRQPRRVIVAGLACVALALSACGAQQAGSAATLGDSRITEQQLTGEVQAILTSQGAPVDSANSEVTSMALGRMIIIDLVQTLADREGVVISQGMIDQERAGYVAEYGDVAAMEAYFISQGVPPSQIEPVIRLNLQAVEIGAKLAPEGTAEEQGQAVYDAVGALSAELEVTVSPRFGTWDPATLGVGPTPDDLSTLPIELLSQ